MLSQIWKLAFAALLLYALPASMAGASDTPKDEAVTNVKAAIEYYKANGKGKTLALLSTKGNPYGKGEAYVDVHDLQGVCLAHPNTPGIIGISRLAEADPKGKYVYKQIVADVQGGKKSGWIDYMRKNPVDGRVEKKTAYWELYDSLIFKAGTYTAD
jgi:signal transduction histidine kinase